MELLEVLLVIAAEVLALHLVHGSLKAAQVHLVLHRNLGKLHLDGVVGLHVGEGVVVALQLDGLAVHQHLGHLIAWLTGDGVGDALALHHLGLAGVADGAAHSSGGLNGVGHRLRLGLGDKLLHLGGGDAVLVVGDPGIPAVLGLGLEALPGVLHVPGALGIAGDDLLGLQVHGEAVGGQGLVAGVEVHIQLADVDIHRSGALAVAVQLGGVVVVEVIPVGRVGIEVDLVVFQVEVQELDVLRAALGVGLVVGTDLVHRALLDAVPVVVEAIGLDAGPVIVAVEHRNDVGVLGHHLVLEQLSGVVQQAVRLLDVGVAVEGDDGLAVGILLEHLVHPLNFLGVDVPAHVEDDEVLSVLGEQVIVAQVVLVGAAVSLLVGKAVLAKVFPVVAVPLGAGVHVVVAAQHAVGHARLVKDLHGLIGVFPLAHHVHIVHNVAGVEHIADFPLLGVVHNPLVHVGVVVGEALSIVLGVGLPGQGEVVLLRPSGAVPLRQALGLQGGGSGDLRLHTLGGALHQQHGLAVHHMVLGGNGLGNGAVRSGLGHLVPALGGVVVDVHGHRVGLVGVAGAAAPRHGEGVVRGGGSGLDGKQLIGEGAVALGVAVSHGNAAILQGEVLTLQEGHVCHLLVQRDAELGGGGGDAVVVGVRDAGVHLLGGEGHLSGGHIARQVRGHHLQGVLAHAQLPGHQGGGQGQGLAVQAHRQVLHPVGVAGHGALLQQQGLVEDAALGHTQVKGGGGVVHHHVGGGLLVSRGGHNLVHAVGEGGGVQLGAHGVDLSGGDAEGGVEIGHHAGAVADGVPGVQFGAGVGLVVVGSDLHRQVAVAVGQHQLEAGDLKVLVVLVFHHVVDLLKGGTAVASPDGEGHVIGLGLGVVGEILVVHVDGPGQGQLTPGAENGDDVPAVVAIGGRHRILEVVVHAAGLDHEVGPVLQHHLGVHLSAIHGNGGIGVVSAVVGGDGAHPGQQGIVGHIQPHAVPGVVEALNGHRLLRRLAHAVQGVGPDLEGDRVMSKEHVGGNLHQEVAQTPLGGLLDAGPLGVVVQLVENFRANEVGPVLQRFAAAVVVPLKGVQAVIRGGAHEQVHVIHHLQPVPLLDGRGHRQPLALTHVQGGSLAVIGGVVGIALEGEQLVQHLPGLYLARGGLGDGGGDGGVFLAGAVGAGILQGGAGRGELVRGGVKPCHGEGVLLRGAQANPPGGAAVEAGIVDLHDVLAQLQVGAVEVVKLLHGGAVAGQPVHHGLAGLDGGGEIPHRPGLAGLGGGAGGVVVVVQHLVVAQIDGLVGLVVHLKVGVLAAVGGAGIGRHLGDHQGGRLGVLGHHGAYVGGLLLGLGGLAGAVAGGDIPLHLVGVDPLGGDLAHKTLPISGGGHVHFLVVGVGGLLLPCHLAVVEGHFHGRGGALIGDLGGDRQAVAAHTLDACNVRHLLHHVHLLRGHLLRGDAAGGGVGHAQVGALPAGAGVAVLDGLLVRVARGDLVAVGVGPGGDEDGILILAQEIATLGAVVDAAVGNAHDVHILHQIGAIELVELLHRAATGALALPQHHGLPRLDVQILALGAPVGGLEHLARAQTSLIGVVEGVLAEVDGLIGVVVYLGVGVALARGLVGGDLGNQQWWGLGPVHSLCPGLSLGCLGKARDGLGQCHGGGQNGRSHSSHVLS